MANINAELEDEVAHLLVDKFGLEVELKQQASLEESLIDTIEQRVDEGPRVFVGRRQRGELLVARELDRHPAAARDHEGIRRAGQGPAQEPR